MSQTPGTFLNGPRRPVGALRRAFRHLCATRRGAIAVEFAMALPVLLVIVLSGVEIARYVLLHQKLARAAVTMSDLVSQAETVSETEIAQLFGSVNPVMQPFDVGPKGVVIVSSVTATDGDPPRIAWQRSGGGSLGGVASELGVEGANATLPTGFVVRDGESALVAEAFYSYTPMFTGGLIGAATIYHRAMFRPRFGSLASVLP